MPGTSQPRPRSKRRQRLLLASVSVVLSLLLAEFAARWWVEGTFLEAVDSVFGTSTAADPGNHAPVVADDLLGFRLNPDLPDVNSRGVRHAEFPAAKPADKFLVLLLGDSVGFPLDGFFAETGTIVRAASGRDLEFVNACVHGYTTHQEWLFLERDLLDLEPDLVVVQYCINDNHRFLHRLTSRGRRLMTPEARNYLFPEGEGVWPWLARHSHLVYCVRRAMLGAATASERGWEGTGRAAWMDETWVDLEADLRAMAERLRAQGGQLAVMAVPHEDQIDAACIAEHGSFVSKPQRCLAAACERLAVPYLDLQPTLLTHRDEGLFTDRLHLTRHGHRLVGKLLADFLIARSLVPAQGAAAPTFAHDVAPIVYRSCSPCHRPGQPAPFSLLSYDDVWKRREQITEVVAQRVMPPWLPAHGDFADDRRLTPLQIDVVRRWIEAGAPRGDAAAEPKAPVFASGWQLREPDLIVKARDVVVVPASGADVVRNLVVPVAVDRLRYVEAVEIRPGSRAVHHAVLGVDRTRESRRLDAADAEPGFPGMTLGGASPPDGHFLGWTPGKSVRAEPPGSAWRLHPGDDFVLQLHVVPTGKAENVQPEIGLHFTDVPTAVEFVPLVMFSEAIDIAPGAADFVLRDHLDLPVPVTLHAIYPHAHFVCRTMRATATLPNGVQHTLFSIPRWDFDWQDDYRYREPMLLPAGTRVAIEYGYDNSEANPNNPARPPRHVRFGQSSADEMGTLTLAVAVAERAQRALLDEACVRRELEKVPNAWNVQLRHARLLRDRGDVAAAVAACRRADELAPGQADTAIELGLCAEVERRVDDAVQHYEEALRRDPERGLAHLQLGALRGRAGDAPAALRHFEQAVRTLPNSAVVQNNLATALFQLDRLDDAAVAYRRALALDPDHFGALLNLGRVLVRQGRRDDARPLLERAARLRPGDKAVAAELETLAR